MYTYNYWCQIARGQQLLTHNLWHSAFSMTQTLPYGIQTVPHVLTQPLGARFTGYLYTLWYVDVNDWPGTAHICQCSVGVPDRGWGNVKVRLMVKCCQVCGWPSLCLRSSTVSVLMCQWADRPPAQRSVIGCELRNWGSLNHRLASRWGVCPLTSSILPFTF